MQMVGFGRKVEFCADLRNASPGPVTGLFPLKTLTTKDTKVHEGKLG